MFCETCEECGHRQMFGYRRVVRFVNESPGVMALTWLCRSCASFSVLRIGPATPATAA